MALKYLDLPKKFNNSSTSSNSQCSNVSKLKVFVFREWSIMFNVKLSLDTQWNSKHKHDRNAALVSEHMRHTIRDAHQAVRETALEKSHLKKKLSSILKNSPYLKARIFHLLYRERKNLIWQIKTKNEKKVKHLQNKFLTKFSDSTIFPVPDE